MIPNSSVNKLAVSKLVVSYENVALLTFILVREWSFIDDYFVPKADIRRFYFWKIFFRAKIERAFLQIGSRQVYRVPLTRGEGQDQY